MILYIKEWVDYSSHFEEGVEISRNWATTHFTFIVMASIGVLFRVPMCYNKYVLRLRVRGKLIHPSSWTYLIIISLCPS